MNRLPFTLVAGCLVGATLASPVASSAQAPAAGVDGTTARIHWGPLALDPKLLINNVGVDSNVFNSPTEPESDFNISAGPQVDEWLRVGRLYLSGQTTVGFTYYRKAKTQRSTDFGQKGRVEARFVHFTPHFSAGYLNSHQRLNAEFDARVPRTSTEVSAGVLVPLGVRTSIDFEAIRGRVKLSDDETGDAALAQLLDRESRGVTLQFNLQYSPLTRFIIRSTLHQDRFDAAVERDSNSVSVVPGVAFTRDALFAGTASVGFRSFMARSANVPDFTGLVADVSLQSMVRDRMKVAFKVQRDVQYSIDPLTPYFVSTGGDVTVNQGIGGGWDLAGRAGATRLGYRGLAGVPDVGSLDRQDTLRILGTGIGRTLTSGIRLGFDFDHARRTSDREARAYSGFRAGGTVSYGF